MKLTHPSPSAADPAEAPDLSRLDHHLGDVMVEEELARTALAAVYRIRTGSHGDEGIALKVALYPCDDEELARFHHEVRLLSEASHPNVVRVFECGSLAGGFPFLTMELLSQTPVQELLGTAGAAEGADWERVYDVAIQAAAGLAHIHRQGVIHHDVKPSNLGLTRPGAEGEPEDRRRRLKILDFGLAQVVRRGLDSRIRGTLAYTAPEVILQDAYDQRADLYSLGLTLFELATGTLPSVAGGKGAGEVADPGSGAARSEEVRRRALEFHLRVERPDPRSLAPSMPAPLAAIIQRLVERDPARRFPSATKLLVELGKASKRRIDPAELAFGGTLLSSRLVGRDDVMSRLRQGLAAATRGEDEAAGEEAAHRVMLLEGAEGMGKSRVLREFRILAALGGARVGLGRANRGSPLAGILEAMSRLAVEVELPPPSATEESGHRERYRVYREIAAALRRQTAEGRPPLVLLLDDMHLAGDEGRELLAFLSAEVSDLPVFILASRQPADEEREDLPTVSLPPLSPAQSEELVDASLGTSGLTRVYQHVHEHGGGSPGRIQELLRHLVDEGVVRYRGGDWKVALSALDRWPEEPGNVVEVESQRLERLRPEARRLLEAAAVIGEPFGLSEVAAILGQDRVSTYGRLSGLVEDGHLERLRESEGQVYKLPRPKLAQRVYEALPANERRELHRRRAEDLIVVSRSRERHGEGEGGGSAGHRDRAASIAHHAWEAGERGEALPYLLRAGRAAVEVHAYAEAEPHYRRATEAAREIDAHDVAAAAAAAQAEALRGLGKYVTAGHVYDRLLDAPHQGLEGEPVFAAAVRLRRARLHKKLGDHESALEVLRRGLAELEEARRAGGGGPLEWEPPAGLPDGLSPMPPGAPRDAEELDLELRRAEAAALGDLNRVDEALERAQEALGRADELGLERQRALLLNLLGMLAYARGDWAEAGRRIRRGLAAAEGLAAGERPASDERPGEAAEEMAIHLRQNLGNVLWKTGDYDAAHDAYAENLRLGEETHDLWGQLTALNNLGILNASRGEWRPARDYLARVLSMARRLGVRQHEAMARLNLGEVEEMLGHWARAERELQGGLALVGEAEEHPLRHALLARLASLARKRGDGPAAVDKAGTALAGAEATDDRDLAAECELLLGQAAKDRDDFAGARAHLARAQELAAGSGTQQLVTRVLISQADLALRRGDEVAAEEAVAAAGELLSGLGDRFAAAKLQAMEAGLASLRGDDDAAGEGYSTSTRTLEALGTPYELGRTLYEWGLRTWNPQHAGLRLRRALRLFEELGAEAEARRARGVLERIEEHTRRDDDRDPVLYEVIKVINSTLDLDEVLDRTMDLVLQHLHAERGMIVLFNPVTRALETAVSRNLGSDDGDGGDEVVELSESVVRRVMDQGEPVVTMDAQVDKRFRGAESIVASHILSILCVPMSIRDRLEGAIYIDHTDTRGLFEEADVRFLVAFAGQAAVAIEKARLYSEQEAARRRLKEENEALKKEILSSHHLGSLIGEGPAIEELKRTMERVAQSDSTVLIRGESGTGKGLVARIIHNISTRREGPFVQFNCAALPEHLVESELFGHEKGAFTGATGQKPGRFELADGGTIFLDEIGKVSPAVQAKLLRVVEDKRFERVGGTKTLKVDLRIIAATNLNLEEAIASGDFREDLYYRLNIIPMVLPPLRERRGDVPYLVDHFLKTISRDLGRPAPELDPAVLELFDRHPWKGNVRELESAIHRALVLSSDDRLTAADFSWIALKSGDPGEVADAAVAGAAVPDLADGGYERALNRYDRRLIEAALDESDGRIRETARLLGIARNTLKAKMERYDIDR